MHKAYLLLGGNIGNKFYYLRKARKMIHQYIGKSIKTSSLYISEPWGFDDNENFLNQVVSIHTQLSPEKLLHTCQQIENKLGRERWQKGYHSRTIDIDILFYDELIIRSVELTIPHPQIQHRRFTLAPLAEIVPQKNHPVLNETIVSLLEKCDDKCRVAIQQDILNCQNNLDNNFSQFRYAD